MEKAVLDRFEDQSIAVLLVGSEEKEFHVKRDLLPSEAKEASLLLVTCEDHEIKSVQLDESATCAQTKRIRGKMAQLREQKKMKRKNNGD
ncbi:DUF3006 domain-containing protein [Alkalihalobacillus sp. FSL R5-0424]